MGDEDLGKVIEERKRRWERALVEAEKFANCVSEKLGRITVIIYGSYARGDFNEWSDVDVLIVVGRKLPDNPLRRLDLVEDCLRLTPGIEPVIVTVEELKRLIEKGNPIVVEALGKGILIVDELELLETK